MSEVVPPSWTHAKIGDLITEVSYGTSAKTNSDATGVPVLRMGNIVSGKLDFEQLKYLPANHDEFPDLFLSPGDVLFNRTNSAELVGKTAVYRGTPKRCSFASYLIRFRLKGALPDWVSLYLNSPLGRACINEVVSQQVGQANVNGTKLKGFTIPLPPLPEQKRIVAKIEELFSELEAGGESLRMARRQLGVYRQSLLKQAFEGKLTAKWRTQNPAKLEVPAKLLARIQSARQSRYEQELIEWERELKRWEKSSQAEKRPAKPRKPKDVQLPTADQVENLADLPKPWSWIAVGNCAVEISDGPFGSNLKSDDYVSAGVRVVRLENIGEGEFIEEKESFISLEKYQKLKRHTVRPGDIVVASFINDAVRAALIPLSIEYAVNKADCFQVHCFGDTISADFLVRCFGARYFFKQLEQLIHGVGRPRINTTQLGEAFVPLCSLPEQQEIVRVLDEQFEGIERNEREIDGALRSSAALRQAILKKAFTGRLVPQDPSDEPATALLARLRAERESGVATTGASSKKRPAGKPAESSA